MYPRMRNFEGLCKKHETDPARVPITVAGFPVDQAAEDPASKSDPMERLFPTGDNMSDDERPPNPRELDPLAEEDATAPHGSYVATPVPLCGLLPTGVSADAAFGGEA